MVRWPTHGITHVAQLLHPARRVSAAAVTPSVRPGRLPSRSRPNVPAATPVVVTTGRWCPSPCRQVPSRSSPRTAAFALVQNLFGQLPSRLQVGERTAGSRVVRHHRLPVAGRLGDPHRTRHRRPEYLGGEVCPNLVGNLRRQAGTPVVHREQNRRDVQLRVEVALDQVHVAQQLGQALQCVVLALDRDEHLLRGHEGVDREQPQAGRQSIRM